MQSEKLVPNIVVPMAGMGSRFSQAGYKDIKPLIPIHGKPMISHVVDSVGIDGNWIFIVQKIHRELYDLDDILNNIRPGCTIVDTGDGVTQGAACSVLLAKEFIDNDSPLIIINSDNIIKWDTTAFDMFAESDSSGLILCFNDTDPKWSFARLDSAGKYVVEVAEKRPISDNATAGMYIWKHGNTFVCAAEQMIAKNIRVNNEFYLAPVYNENILMGDKIVINIVNEMHGVGTPEDLERYLAR
jgi:dTDP-glucose pyrophosphorylase